MKEYGVPVAAGKPVFSPEEAATATKSFGGKAVVKSQVLAGGRGMGHLSSGLQGGVHLVSSPEDAKDKASQMLGHTLVTKQTGAGGRPVDALYVVEQVQVGKEMYLSMLMDRATAGPVIIASAEGGMSIEELAVEKPEAVLTLPVRLDHDAAIDGKRMMVADVDKVREHLQIEEGSEAAEQFTDCIQGLAQLFWEKDVTLLEVNPLARLEPKGDIVCLDAKINFDDNAEFRQKKVFDMRDNAQIDGREVEAGEWDLNYIGLDGSIGCLVNGAGLAMATMDIVSLYGGSPANFLDVGGSATVEQVQNAMRIVRKDEHVKSILVNIFGGIMRCDVIAEGVIADMRSVPEGKPIPPVVMRLKGTNVEEARKIVAECGLPLRIEDDFDVAAQQAVAEAKKSA